MKIKRHPFAQGQLILPNNYYDLLIEKLGSNLVQLELELPESVDSQALINYSSYISKNNLCRLRIARGEKDTPSRKNIKILDESG